MNRLSSINSLCPKCGEEMKDGMVRFFTDEYKQGNLSPFLSGFSPTQLESKTSIYEPFWEEKTGKKTWFLIKTDEKVRLIIKGKRCKVCGYVEIYVI